MLTYQCIHPVSSMTLLPTPAVQLPAWSRAFSHIILFVCALKWKRLELSAPKSVDTQSMAGRWHALTQRSKGQILTQIDTTAHFSSWLDDKNANCPVETYSSTS